MTKIAIVGDPHFGIRNDSPFFLEHYIAWFCNAMETWKTPGLVDRVVVLGDFLDRRKYINFNTLKQVRTRVLEPLNRLGIPIDFIAGNHDLYWRNNSDVSSLEELIGDRYPNIRVHLEPISMLDGDVLLVPWINEQNFEKSFAALDRFEGRYVFGHFEINGFEPMRGHEFTDGLESSVFDRFKCVFTGHFHCRQRKKNIFYVGTPYDMIVSDRNEFKGWHLLDTSDGELTEYPTTSHIFMQFNYSDRGEGSPVFIKNGEGITEIPIAEVGQLCKDKVVRLVVHKRVRPMLFDQIHEEIEASAHALAVEIVEEVEFDLGTDAVDLSKSAVELIEAAVDDLGGVPDAPKLKLLLRDLYLESLTRTTVA